MPAHLNDRDEVTNVKRCVHINFNGKLIGKGRPRFGRGRAYTPAKTVAAERSLGWIAKEAMSRAGLPLLAGPLRLSVSVMALRPPSWSKKKALATTFITGKPDADNQIKLIGDALNGIVWNDDSQIAEIEFRRVYAHADCIYIRVSQI